MIAIIDYGMGNLASIENMIKKVGGKAFITSNEEDILNASAIILPGVGAFDHAVIKLNESGLDNVILKAVSKGKTLLGICLGMQLLFDSSEEGALNGLGIIPGKVFSFDLEDKTLKIPHMGWNKIYPKNISNESLYSELVQDNRFYFVHSFRVECLDDRHISATCLYGDEFTCSVQKGSVYGAQFHPEKSHKFGKSFFKKFLELI